MLVVDASVAVKFITAEAGSDAAHEIIVSADVLIAPDWLLVEVASAMWKKVKRSQLLKIHAEDNMASLPEFSRGSILRASCSTKHFVCRSGFDIPSMTASIWLLPFVRRPN